MSKTWEHYHHAARHHERAAYHYMQFITTLRLRNFMPNGATAW